MEHSDELMNAPSILPEGLVNLAKELREKSKPDEFETAQDSFKTHDEYEAYKSKDDTFDFEGNDNGETLETMPLEDFADIDPDQSAVNTHEVLQRLVASQMETTLITPTSSATQSGTVARSLTCLWI